MATLDEDGGCKYPEAISSDEPNNRRPIDNLQGSVPKVLEPISTDDLDKLHSLKSDSNACLDDWANNNTFETMMDFESMSESIYAEYNNIDTFLDDVDLFSIYPELESSSKPADIPPEDDIDFSEYFDFDKYYADEESSSKPAENPNTSSEHSSSSAHPCNSDFAPAPTGSNGFVTSSISPTESGTTPTISSKPRETSSSSDSSAPEDLSGPGSGGPATRSKAAHFDRVGGSKAPGDEALADGVDVRRAFWQNVVNGHTTDGSGPSPCGPPQNDSTMHNGQMHGSAAQNDPEIQNGPKPPHVPKMQHGISMPMHVPKMQNGVLTYNGVPMPRDFSLGSLMNADPIPSCVSPLSTGIVPWDIFLMLDDTMSQDSASIQNFPMSDDGSFILDDPTPPCAPQMQNSAVPPNSSLLQNDQMFQFLPSQNSPVLQYGRPIQNGSVPSFGPSTHNSPVSRYGRPIRNGSAPQYEFPTQNGSMTSYGPSMRNGSASEYWLPTQNDLMASYGPSMRTGSASEYWFSAQNDSMPSYGPPMHNAPMPPAQNGTMLPNSALMHNGTMSAYDPPMQNPRISTDGGYFEPTDRQASARQGTIVRATSGRIPRRQGPSGYASHGSNSSTQGRNLRFPNGYVNDRQVADDPEEEI